MKKKAVLIGAYPPPLGGISVFIDRLSKKLKQENHDVKVYDFSKLSKIEKGFFFFSILVNPVYAEYQLNEHNTNIMLVLLARPFSKKIIFIDHNQRAIEKFSTFQKWIFQFFIKKIDQLVFVNEKINEYYVKHNIIIARTVSITPAFIPPFEIDEQKILSSYPQSVREFLKTKFPVIIANACRIDFHNGEDLYGLDLCIELVDRLKVGFPSIGIVFALADNTKQPEHLIKMKELIEQKQIKPNFVFLSGQQEIWPLFKLLHLMIRPTNTDGDAVSIREALHFGCPVLASDVCRRPENVTTFISRDIKDAVRKAVHILNNKV